MKIIAKLAEIFGKDIIYSIAFINNNEKIFDFIENKLGSKAKNLYINVLMETENEFHYKYYDYMKTYNGLNGIKQKAINYGNIDYTKVYKLIENYKKQKNSGI